MPFGCDRIWPLMALIPNAQEEEDLRSTSAFTDFDIGFGAGSNFLSGPQANDLAHDPSSFFQALKRPEIPFRITA
ncbi:MAG: hypothetical protein MUF11_01205 [Beijerinckiaceae bacterium]|jgi:hypothetical protein|nr:hypothetical protein [Beijerinckiaceae bacterium]